MAGGRAADGVNGFGNPVQGRVGANADIGAIEVIVNGTGQPGNNELLVLVRFLPGQPLGGNQFV